MHPRNVINPVGLAALVISPVFADFQSEVVADLPLVFYRFEESLGATTLADSSGNGLDIDYSIPAGTTALGEEGVIGSAARFFGDGAIVTPLDLDPSLGDFTIEAVVKSETAIGDMVILANQDGTLGPGRSNLVVNFARTYTSFSGGATTSSGVSVTEGGFDHVILTYDASAAANGVDPTFRFYVNGIEAGTSLIVPEAANGNWVIGANKVLTTQLFNGWVDELAVYDKRLDDLNGDGDLADSRVSAHYKGYLEDADTLVSFESSAPYVDGGQSLDLSWFVSPALSSLTLDDGSGPIDVLAQTLDCQGQLSVTPSKTTTYTLSGEGPQGSEDLEVTVVVDEPAVIDFFSANSAAVASGGTVLLNWSVTNGVTVEIDQGVGLVDASSGSISVVVEEATTFTLTASNSQGPVTAQVEVDIIRVEDPSLIAHWRVGETEGETSGTSLVSETGDLFLGTFVGTPMFDTQDPAPVPGGSTASLVFDGNNSWVDILGYNGIGGSEARTVAFWFKGPDFQTNNHGTLVGWGTGATGTRYDTRVNANGTGIIRTEVAGSGSNGTAIMADDTWHHCAVVLDPTIGTTVGDLQFYIDGQLDLLSAVGGTPINTSQANNVRIGASQGIAGRSLTGKMDDIRIYNRALSAEEIEELVTVVNIPLEITSITRLENGNVAVDWSGPPGEYFFEYSFDLTEGSWLDISDSEIIEDGETSTTSIDNFIAPNQANRKVFYRVRLVD